MGNLELAKLFYEIADILELKGVKWKPRAYRTAARAIETLRVPVETYYKEKALSEISGVGKSIEAKIVEFIKTGKIKGHDRLVKSAPGHLLVLMKIPGIGPKKTAALYRKLKITSLKQLEQACRKHKVRELLGFDAKTEKEILEGIELMKKGFGTRIPLMQAEAAGEKIVSRLKKSKYVLMVSVAGSLRRRKATVRDIDIMVSTNKPEKVIEIFTKMPDVKKITAKGKRKSTVILKSGIQADVRVFPAEQWGSGLLYFTGSKAFNIIMRRTAIKKGYKLNEYGLFKNKRRIAGKTEAEIFKKLGMKYVKPEKREI